MVIRGKIHHIVHNKLRPPKVYLSLEEPFLPGVQRKLVELDALGILADESLEKILEKAAAIADRKVKEMEPEE
ncbi:hypothetical protein MUP01_06790 [Candidatus Bathyarchaeota archaeon]|nr:hypothetical protein [Candidatus Bathyarchaeota archaeon]